MIKVGLIGGISWHATSKYYGFINQAVNDHFGDNTNPPLMTYNVNQSLMHKYQKKEDWEAIGEMIYEGAQSLINGGCEMLMICSNTTHKVFPYVQKKIDTPLLHIGDSTAEYIQTIGCTKVGFIGTKFNMMDEFLINRIRNHNIEVVLPHAQKDILELHRIIHEELTYNKTLPASKEYVSNLVQRMKKDGAQGLILGCTEFSLMFEEMDLDIHVFDTVELHAKGAVEYILGKR